MDLLWFLRRRLDFGDRLYDQTTAPFQETIRKINAGEPPFEYVGDPDYVGSDPPFLEEYQQAAESIEVIGHWCLCMVYASLRAYLEEYLAEMARDYRQAFEDLPARLASKKAKSWFERHRLLFLDEMGIDWRKGPVKLEDLEHLNLARDDVTHNVDVMSIYAYQTERHAARYPKGLFIDDLWSRLNLGGRIRVGRDELSQALGMGGDFCAWLEEIRNRYPAYVRTFATIADSEPPTKPRKIPDLRRSWREESV
jgi:hypothetical protein